jgi:hypothetical protein
MRRKGACVGALALPLSRVEVEDGGPSAVLLSPAAGATAFFLGGSPIAPVLVSSTRGAGASSRTRSAPPLEEEEEEECKECECDDEWEEPPCFLIDLLGLLLLSDPPGCSSSSRPSRGGANTVLSRRLWLAW